MNSDVLTNFFFILFKKYFVLIKRNTIFNFTYNPMLKCPWRPPLFIGVCCWWNTRFIYKNILFGLKASKEIEIDTSKITSMFLNFVQI